MDLVTTSPGQISRERQLRCGQRRTTPKHTVTVNLNFTTQPALVGHPCGFEFIHFVVFFTQVQVFPGPSSTL